MRVPLYRLVLLPLAAGGLVALSLSGCMPPMMPGMPQAGSHPGSEAHLPAVQEQRSSEVVVELRVPPLTLGRETILTVSLRRAAGGSPVSRAKVAVMIEPLDRPADGSAVHSSYPAPDLGYSAEVATAPGTYELRHTFAAHARYRITARVWPDGQNQTALPLVLTVTAPTSDPVTGGHRLTGMGVAGGLGMVLMMGLMLGRVLF